MKLLYLSLFFVGTFVTGRTLLNSADLKCLSPTSQKNFDIEKFMGNWHIAQISPMLLATQIECMTVSYTKLPNGQIVSNMTGIDLKTKEVGVEESFVSQSPEDLARLTIFTPKTFQVADLLIVGTDYETYAVSYTCDLFQSYPKEEYLHIIRIHTRDYNPQEAVLKKAHDDIQRAGLGVLSHEIGTLKQTGCHL